VLWARVASAQGRPDDAGDTHETAGVLHAGINTCYSDYLLPRRMDVDVWGLHTQVGKVYRVSSHPVDDVTEAFWSLPQWPGVWSREQGLRVLGYEVEPYLVRGDGETEYFTIAGIASVTGESRRYEIVVDEHDDAGDAEPDTFASAIPLVDGEWLEGVSSPPGHTTGISEYSGERLHKTDIDCFSYAYADRGVYRLEVEQIGQAVPTDFRVSVAIRGRVPSEPDATLGSTWLSNLQRMEMRGPGVLGVYVERTTDTGPERAPYRLRLTQINLSAPDDHGNLPSLATPVAADGHAVHGTLGSFNANGLTSQPGPDAGNRREPRGSG
jgi:hypothetical protein